MRKKLGIKTIDDEILDALNDKSMHDKMIQTCPNYVITSNTKYATKF